MHRVFFEIGGNQGDKLNNISVAKELIDSEIGVIIEESKIFESPAWGFQSDMNFYNQVLLVETEFKVQEVLALLLSIEIRLGRVRSEKQFSSRTMDIDILFFDQEIINTDSLIVPHPRLHLRNFVLVPMNDIAPAFVHPVMNKSMSELLIECTDDSVCVALELS